MVSLRKPSAVPVVGVVADRRTYANLAYLLVSAPLGIAYSMLLTFGVVFGTLLSVVAVGVGVLFATLIGSRLLAGIERRLANAAWSLDLRRPDDVPDDADGLLPLAKGYVDASSTWRGLGFLSLKVWIAVPAVFLLFGIATVLSLVAAPVRYPYTVEFGTVNGDPVTWTIDTLPEAALAVPVALCGLLVVLHASNAVAYVARRMAIGLLGRRRDGG
ncbi:sensor domain-containing protein [Halorubrum rubrum]|uniref:Sensor domain-containing protein n=1 Tax=Halorubrum rubrum TaxID=1126240 RepID=A0ABD5R3Z7_9EURY|nr:sensor domain-containing protein [Halorubrum rubrum]